MHSYSLLAFLIPLVLASPVPADPKPKLTPCSETRLACSHIIPETPPTENHVPLGSIDKLNNNAPLRDGAFI
ncbi:hypothetical protein DSO57_1000644 [Entomophthora muscae]|uniref:Uncharacterized protein n=1 Tax=Entomophthora muscae TaxID=34485 RepID=A0ACC2S079_9FUNG|nr:hypothetical protein DSO57_1000644 [Entomophthora muscae]